MKRVEVRISRDGGKVVLNADGFSGGECIKRTEDLMGKLGMIQSTEHKPEYFQGAGECVRNDGGPCY